MIVDGWLGMQAGLELLPRGQLPERWDGGRRAHPVGGVQLLEPRPHRVPYNDRYNLMWATPTLAPGRR